jgi:DNA-directed RNA polymerase subunit beta
MVCGRRPAGSAGPGWVTGPALDMRLSEIFDEISPIEDSQGKMALSFLNHRFEDPKYSVGGVQGEGLHLRAPLFVTAEFLNKDDGTIKSQTVFMGDFPVMTDKGTFIINGTERVVVSQLVRSPGVYFDTSIDKTTGRTSTAARSSPAAARGSSSRSTSATSSRPRRPQAQAADQRASTAP